MSEDALKNLTQQDMEKILEKAEDVANGMLENGKMHLQFKPDGVFLTITPPGVSGLVITLEHVARELDLRGIKNVDSRKVQQVVKEMKGVPELIAPHQEECEQDGHVLVELSKNKMEAYITVYPPRGKGKPVTRNDIEKALKDNNVVHGILENAIDFALKSGQMGEVLTIAAGSEPVDGESAVIEYKVNSASLGKPEELVDGRVDFYNLHMIQNVEPGQELAVKIPAKPGTSGFTVTGVEIPAKPGKDVQLTVGKNVKLSDDRNIAVAAANGHVVIAGNTISVSNIYEINGDVDFNTGNIEFNGTVVVKGSLREGFKIVADGDVDVMGNISDGIVECTGTLKVKNGIIGRSKSRIKAGGSVISRFIENSVLESGIDVIVGEAIMHSRVNARKSVVVGGKGVIVGGLVRAGEEINCKTVGSSMATATELETGVNPELRRRCSVVSKEKQAKEADLEKAEKAVKLLKHLEQTQGSLPDDKKAILVRVAKVHGEITREIEELKTLLADIEAQIQQSGRGRIKVHGVICPGVKVTIGSATMQVFDDLPFVTLTNVMGEIKINPYK
ncbi:FapA family protein [Phosphitispora sp. TUW77]|uniref:FapA family protein n=1 Tax=Phosphitispora sp. TUW77 TaxID=3152361 RepID=UPI003AB41C0D